MGDELIARGLPRRGLWSAKALLDNPELVQSVHRDYIEAGADIITTNSYSTIPSYLGKEGLADQYEQLTSQAGKLARSTVEACNLPNVRVAGSIPPLDESYRYDLVPPDDEAEPIYQNLVRALNPWVDLFLCETMSSAREAKNAAQAATELGEGKPVWVAWTLHETPGMGLRSGETIGAALAAVAPYKPQAYLFNCCQAETISPALQALRELTDLPVGVYPNLFSVPQDWTLDNNVSTQRREMPVAEFLEFAAAWQNLGATIIGGCCGIGPSYISALAETRSPSNSA